MKFFKMLKQECVSKTDNFVKEFDAALTLETEGLKKMPWRKKKKKIRCYLLLHQMSIAIYAHNHKHY